MFNDKILLKNKALKYIGIVSLLITIIFPLINISYIYPTFTRLLIKNTEEEAVRLATHLSSMFFKKRNGLTEATLPDGLLNELDRIKNNFNLLELKIFLPSGKIIYSTNPKDIGKMNKKIYFHEIIAKGKTYTKIVQKDTKSPEGQMVTADVVETYVPVMDGNTFIGALEIYYDITSRDQELNKVVFFSSIIPLFMIFSFLGVIVMFLLKLDKNITNRKWAEEALKHSYEFTKTVLDSMNDAVSIVDVNTFRIVGVNSVFLKEFGPNEEEIIGKTCHEITHNQELPCTPPHDICPLMDTVTTGKHAVAEHIHYDKNGEKIYVEVSTAPIRDENGKVIQVVHVARDITKRKQIEEDLLKSQEALIEDHKELKRLFKQVETVKKEWESTMDCIGDIVILADNQERIQRCNRALLEFTGGSYNDILGKDWEVLLNEYELKTGTFYGRGIELFHEPTGQWFVLNSYPFKDINGNENSGTVITIHNSTELKRVSEELERKNRELEKAYTELKATQAKIFQQEKMASIGQLAAGVAHEINNPMGFISSNLGTLHKYVNKLTEFINTQTEVIESLKSTKALEELKDKRRRLKLDYILRDVDELIEESLDGAERVKKIVQNLKSFSRVDEAEHKHADINECIESTLNIVWNELKYKAAVKKDYGEISLTKCYPQQLNQVFMNLLVNAAQAIEKQGEIRIKTWNGDGSIFISISDTGHGIPGDKFDRIFEPFFTTKKAGKGTGLGLSITYDIVKKHNGEITVKSEVGKGTTFTTKIPVVEGR